MRYSLLLTLLLSGCTTLGPIADQQNDTDRLQCQTAGGIPVYNDITFKYECYVDLTNGIRYAPVIRGTR